MLCFQVEYVPIYTTPQMISLARMGAPMFSKSHAKGIDFENIKTFEFGRVTQHRDMEDLNRELNVTQLPDF